MLRVSILNILFVLIRLSLSAQEKTEAPKTEFRQLLQTTCDIEGLTFSSDGLYLAYSCDGDIYYTGLRDGNPRTVTSSQFIETNPKWSPDGTKIAYQKDSSEISSIWVYSKLSNVHTRVTKIKENTFDPSWAPNGKMIAFSTDTYGSVDVMIKDFNYNKEKRLTAAKGDEFIFGFHPGGKYVGYYERGTEEEDIYAVSLTGKEALPLTRSEALEFSPQWTYDGTRVIYYLTGPQGKSIYTADFPYGELNEIGTYQFEVNPVISANGEMVVFQDQKNDRSELYLYVLERRETMPLGLEEFNRIDELTWSLGGRIIAFSTGEAGEESGIWLLNISQLLK